LNDFCTKAKKNVSPLVLTKDQAKSKIVRRHKEKQDLQDTKKRHWKERTDRAIAQAKKIWPAYEKYLDFAKDQRPMKVYNSDERATQHLIFAVSTARTQKRYDKAQEEMHKYFTDNPVKFLFLKIENRTKLEFESKRKFAHFF